MKELRKNISKWMYWFILAVAIIIVYKFFDNFTAIGEAIGKFFDVIEPFLLGILIAYLLYIPASRIEKRIEKSKSKFIKNKARGLSVLITFVLAVVLILILVNCILPIVTESIMELMNNFQMYWNTAVNKLSSLPEDSILKNDKVTEAIQSLGNGLQEIDFKQYVNPERLTTYVKSVLGVATGIFDMFVTIIVSIYILLERAHIIRFFKKLGYAIFDKKVCQKVAEYFNSTNKIFFKFISSQLLDAVIVGILVTIAMSIIGVRYAILLGFMIGLFNVIPYFGAIVAVAISILITLITGGISQTIIMAIAVIILQQIDSNIINPKIIGNSLEMSPLLVIFSVTVGGAYFGVLGMFLAVPVAAVLKILINDYIDYKNSKKEKIEKIFKSY